MAHIKKAFSQLYTPTPVEVGRELIRILRDGGSLDIEKIKILIGQGARLDLNSNGFTALHLATTHMEEDAALLLIEAGADVRRKNSMGQTPLHLAACWGQAKTARVLLEKGASPTDKNDRGQTPVDMAREELGRIPKTGSIGATLEARKAGLLQIIDTLTRYPLEQLEKEKRRREEDLRHITDIGMNGIPRSELGPVPRLKIKAKP